MIAIRGAQWRAFRFPVYYYNAIICRHTQSRAIHQECTVLLPQIYSGRDQDHEWTEQWVIHVSVCVVRLMTMQRTLCWLALRER